MGVRFGYREDDHGLEWERECVHVCVCVYTHKEYIFLYIYIYVYIYHI